MSANDYMIEALTRHQIFVQRFGGGEVRKILPFLRSMALKIGAQISAQEGTQFNLARLSIIEAELQNIISEGIGDIQKQVILNMTEFGVYESEFMQKTLNSALIVKTVGVTPEQIRASITTKPMTLIKGKTTQNISMQEAFRHFSETASTDIRRSIQSGIATGKTTDQITREVRRVMGSRTKNQAEALVRTVTNHTATVARDATTQANSDIIEGERFIATLDGSTTMTCAGFDGNRYGIGEGPHPALHWNCRSTRVPILKREFQALQMDGERPSKGDDGKDTASGKKTYSGFLKSQSKEFQNEVLGPERAKLFRSGDVTIDRFTNDKGIVYSLDELKARENLTIN